METDGVSGSPIVRLRRDQPWEDKDLARLYDAFPFEGDLPLYLELATAEGGKVLELCCGTGRVLVPLARAGCRVVGVDVSPHMLELAWGKLAGLGAEVEGRARLVQQDIRDLELGEQFPMAVIAVKSIAYLLDRADQQRVLERVATHLQPGGLLAIDLMNPSLEWLSRPPGSLWQDVVARLEDGDVTVARTETVMSTDLATQVRWIRSVYEVIGGDGSVKKLMVEWPYRFIYRFEAEHLLERSGYAIEALYGGYGREPFESASPHMIFLARRRYTEGGG